MNVCNATKTIAKYFMIENACVVGFAMNMYKLTNVDKIMGETINCHPVKFIKLKKITI